MMLLLTACSQVAEGNKAAAQSLTRWKNDTGKTWSNLFTYNPAPTEPKPASTRYCYQYASDIVCYDNPQPQLTAKLVGVQGGEGPRMIVHQAAPDAGYSQVTAAPMFPSDVTASMDTAPIAMQAPSNVLNGKDIQSRDLPAPFAKKTP
ncbi:MAG: hypothetical protein C0436_04340 [Alphaproteobacteria bacterium]|nr:hypothetical protein [Alphaproteobacteria bacterium]